MKLLPLLFNLESLFKDLKSESETVFWLIVAIIFITGIAFNIHNIFEKQWKSLIAQIVIYIIVVAIIKVGYNYITTTTF